MICQYCSSVCIKKGFNGAKQKYYCKTCHRYQQQHYHYRRCTIKDQEVISKLTCIGVGISGIAAYTGISKAHVINLIRKIAQSITLPPLQENQQEYEMDELHTYIRHKQNPIYLIYAINKRSKQLVRFAIGPRTKEQIQKITNELNSLSPSKVFTDKLNVYPGLFNSSIHRACAYKINHIERFNLTLRNQIKRLSRKTICYSKCEHMLEYVLKIYFHHRQSRC